MGSWIIANCILSLFFSFFLSFLFLGSSPYRGQIPVEWGDFPYVRTYIRLYVCPFIRPSVPPLGHPARPEAQPARPEAQPF